MSNIFGRYATVGVLNTIIHWIVFFLFFYLFGVNQAFSNLLAFCIAVSFSFFINARYTFYQSATGNRYLAYVAFMGAMSAAVGAGADILDFDPAFTLVLFSIISLVVGFFYSKLVVFREKNK